MSTVTGQDYFNKYSLLRGNSLGISNKLLLASLVPVMAWQPIAPTVGGLTVHPYYALCLLMSIFLVLRKRLPFTYLEEKTTILTLGLTGTAIFLSTLINGSSLVGMLDGAQTILMVFSPLALVFLIKNYFGINRWLKSLAFYGLLSALMMILSYSFGYSDPRYLMKQSEWLGTQYFVFAGFSIVAFIGARKNSLVSMLLMIPLAFSLIISQARMTWLGVMLALFVIFLLSRNRNVWLLAIGVPGILAGLALIYYVDPEIYGPATSRWLALMDRLPLILDHPEELPRSIRDRLANIALVIHIIQNSPILGFGFKETIDSFSVQHDIHWAGSYPIGHSFYVELLFRAGLMGLIPVLIIFINAMIKILKELRSGDPYAEEKAFLFIFSAVILVFNSTGKESWFLFAVIISIYTHRSAQRNNSRVARI